MLPDIIVIIDSFPNLVPNEVSRIQALETMYLICNLLRIVSDGQGFEPWQPIPYKGRAISAVLTGNTPLFAPIYSLDLISFV